MAFETATLAQRQAVVDAAVTFDKLSNLAHNTGSLQIYGPQVDAAAIPLNAALADAGIGGGASGPVVEGGQAVPLLKLNGTSMGTASALVEDDVFEGVELAATATVVTNASNVVVRESDGTSIVSSSCPAVVTGGTLSYVTLPPAIGVLTSTSQVPVQINGSTSTAATATGIVANGKVTGVKLPASTAVVANSGTVTGVTNSAATSGLAANGTAVVTSAGNISNVKLPATHTLFPSGYALTGVAPTGTYTSTVTFTVAGGLITAITLS